MKGPPLVTVVLPTVTLMGGSVYLRSKCSLIEMAVSGYLTARERRGEEGR